MLDETNPGKGIRVIGYAPFKCTAPDGRQMLIQIFADDDGITSVQVAYRMFDWDTWSPPITAVRA